MIKIYVKPLTLITNANQDWKSIFTSCFRRKPSLVTSKLAYWKGQTINNPMAAYGSEQIAVKSLLPTEAER